MSVKVLPPSADVKSNNFIFPKILRNFFKPSEVHRRRSIDRNASSSTSIKRENSVKVEIPPAAMYPIFSYTGKKRRSSAFEEGKKISNPVLHHLRENEAAQDCGYYSYSDLMHHHVCDRSIASTSSTNSSGDSSFDGGDERSSKSGSNIRRLIRTGSFKGESRHRRAASLRVDPQKSDCWNLHRQHLHIDHQGHRRVMLAVDGSQSSERAFRWYLDYMMEPCDRVILVTVATPRLILGSGLMPANSRDSEADTQTMMRSSQMLIQRFLNRAGAARDICEAYAYMSCRQADSLLMAARYHRVDVIVMGSRGAGKNLKSFLLGSVSKSVLRSSTVPVTIVPPYDLTPCQDDAQIKIRAKLPSKKKSRKHSM